MRLTPEQSLAVAKQTIDEWVEDETGRVYVHKDVIRKAVEAAITNLQQESSASVEAARDEAFGEAAIEAYRSYKPGDGPVQMAAASISNNIRAFIRNEETKSLVDQLKEDVAAMSHAEERILVLEAEVRASVEAALREAAAACRDGAVVAGKRGFQQHAEACHSCASRIDGMIPPGHALQRYGERQRLAIEKEILLLPRKAAYPDDPYGLVELDAVLLILRSRVGAPERKT
jgi:hypothetical protein